MKSGTITHEADSEIPLTDGTPENSSQDLPPEMPSPMDMETLHGLSHKNLLELIASRNLPLHRDSSRHHLTLDLARDQLKRGGVLTAEGILEFAPDAPMIRWAQFNFQPTQIGRASCRERVCQYV